MPDIKQKIIDFLLENADPSIALRVKREILGYLSENDEHSLTQQIARQKNVQTILQSQKPDGWIGNHFHGQSQKSGAGMFDNMEVGLRYLAEKGFPAEHEYVAKAVSSFLSKAPFDSAYGVKPPKPPDTDYTYTASGLYLARSSVMLRAGYEAQLPSNHFIDLHYDVDFSLKTFLKVLDYTFPDDVVWGHRKKPCFQPGVMWPCLYHLRILAHSHAWRSGHNIGLLSESIIRLYALPQSDETIYTYINGQYVSPCLAFLGEQGRLLGAHNEKDISLDLLELFARCGILGKVSELNAKLEYLLSRIDADMNVNIDLNKRYVTAWSPYFGYALEENWRTNTKKQCDLLFRVLLIIHYAG